MNDVTPTPATPAQTGRYSLNDSGEVLFQTDASNPLPGTPAGKLVKGEAMLSPKTDVPAAQEWLDIHVRSVLEPLFLLKAEGEGALPEGAAREIGAKLYDHLGVMHRADLEDEIGKLDADTRKALRNKGVRLGPILVFLPALVKPVAVKMRALLWGLWNGKTLPVVRPSDGRVSEVVDPAAVDRQFYRMIGYPVFGPRAIRIDMLDRVITDVYDTADKGVFEAKHKYAEWLGTNLDDLHAVLESMGHRKLKAEAPRPDEIPTPPETPHENPTPDSEPSRTPPGPSETPPPQPEPAHSPEGPAEVPSSPEPTGIPLEAPSAAVAAVVASAKPAPVVIKFMLKKGKMSDRPQSRARKPERNKGRKKPAFDPNTPILLNDEDKARIKAREEEREKMRSGGRAKKFSDGNDRPRKPKRDNEERVHAPRDKKGRTQSNEGRVYSFEATKKDGDDDGNPFAILKNLKK